MPQTAHAHKSGVVLIDDDEPMAYKTAPEGMQHISGDRIGGHCILWGSPYAKDITGEYFTPETTNILSIHRALGKTPVIFDHGTDATLGADLIGLSDKMAIDEQGVWAETVLNASHGYYRTIRSLVDKGALHYSSGALPKARKAAPDGRLLRWPIIELSTTPRPAEFRMMERPLRATKSAYLEAGLLSELLKAAQGTEEVRQLWNIGFEPDQVRAEKGAINLPSDTTGVPQMTLQEQLAMKITEARQALEAGDVERGRDLRLEAESIKSALDELDLINGIVSPEPMRPPLPGSTGTSSAAKSADVDLFYTSRIKDEPDVVKSVYKGILGSSYRDFMIAQERAFAKYIRGGERSLNGDDVKALSTQVFPSSDVLAMVRDGYDTAAIKTTMVEAQGTLGGYAVPPTVQENIIVRLPGLTAVRGNGARVIDLTAGNAIDVPSYTGGTDRYRGNIRGVWGAGEVPTMTEKNATFGTEQLVADLYTYKLSMSQTLVEDARNLIQLIQDDISDVLAIDEDQEFLIGNGIGRPLGILPGSANALSLTEVVSLASSTLTTAGIKNLRRGLATQYRKNAVVIGNSDTFGDIENLTVSGTGSDFAFPQLSVGQELMGAKVAESEAMPDVAGSAFPLIYGDLSGYWIVQKAGLTIVRFQDSNTGINKVEYHVRRRVGGRLVEPWKFAVQKVAAS